MKTRGPGDFKPGPLSTSRRKYPNVQFVPVYLENLSRILPKGEFILVPLLAAAHFGAPIALRRAERIKHAFLDRARASLIALGEGCREGDVTSIRHP